MMNVVLGQRYAPKCVNCFQNVDYKMQSNLTDGKLTRLAQTQSKMSKPVKSLRLDAGSS